VRTSDLTRFGKVQCVPECFPLHPEFRDDSNCPELFWWRRWRFILKRERILKTLQFICIFLALRGKEGLWNHHAACVFVCVCVCSLNFWIRWPIFKKRSKSNMPLCTS
jgi:hypothetical protein